MERQLQAAFRGPWGRRWSWLSEANVATDRRLRRAVARRLALAGGETVLDLGAGAAPWSRPIARLAPDLRTVHVDLSEPLLRAARRRLRLTPGRHLFVCADALALPLASGSVERVICANVLGLQRSSEPLLAECARALAPGGRLLIVDLFEDTPLRRLAAAALKAAVWLSFASSRAAISRHRRLRSADLEPMLEAAGFGAVRFDPGLPANGLISASRR